MSRNSRSGRSTRTACIASAALPHSPTISTSSWLASAWRRASRASTSSSTSTVRRRGALMRRARRTAGAPRHGCRRRGSALSSSRAASPNSMRSRDRVLPRPMPSSVPVGGRPRPSSSTRSCSWSPSRRVEMRSVPAPGLSCRPWRSAFSTSGCRIRFGTAAASVSSSTSSCVLQPILEAHLLDAEIAGEEFQFARQRHLRRVALLQGQPQEVAQPRDHQSRLQRIGQRQRGDRVERVEQEVRLQLHAQRLQLRLRQLRLQLRVAQAFVAQVPARLHPAQHRQDHPVGDQALLELVGELHVQEAAQRVHRHAGPGRTADQNITSCASVCTSATPRLAGMCSARKRGQPCRRAAPAQPADQRRQQHPQPEVGRGSSPARAARRGRDPR